MKSKQSKARARTCGTRARNARQPTFHTVQSHTLPSPFICAPLVVRLVGACLAHAARGGGAAEGTLSGPVLWRPLAELDARVGGGCVHPLAAGGIVPHLCGGVLVPRVVNFWAAAGRFRGGEFRAEPDCTHLNACVALWGRAAAADAPLPPCVPPMGCGDAAPPGGLHDAAVHVRHAVRAAPHRPGPAALRRAPARHAVARGVRRFQRAALPAAAHWGAPV